MDKCKIFISNEAWDLENQINNWFKSIKDKEYYNMNIRYAISDKWKSVFITYYEEEDK